jgi:hypothetical protein
LKSEEVFVLAPGQAVALSEWIPPLYLPAPGTHEVQLTYRNDPNIEMRQIGTTREASQRLKGSTPCEMKSNVVVLRVKERRP